MFYKGIVAFIFEESSNAFMPCDRRETFQIIVTVRGMTRLRNKGELHNEKVRNFVLFICMSTFLPTHPILYLLSHIQRNFSVVLVQWPVTVAVRSEAWVLAGWLLGSWVRIPLKAGMFVRVFLCCVVLCW
jgi:hypothetical protein